MEGQFISKILSFFNGQFWLYHSVDDKEDFVIW